jgi:hypothetical protein
LVELGKNETGQAEVEDQKAEIGVGSRAKDEGWWLKRILSSS